MRLAPLRLDEKRYVTLSYTWGRSIDPVLQWPQFFIDEEHLRFDALPLTIRDAITAVKMLGEEYLWVDLICINQTDKHDLQRQLAQMDLVYGISKFTLVALYGTSMDDGLPGVSTVARKNVEKQVNIRCRSIICGPHIDFPTALRTSRWRERAWTFQEERLSRRLVFFGDHEVLIRCTLSGRETLEWKTSNIYGSLSSDPELWEEQCNTGFGDVREWDVREYQGQVQEYTSRKLSFASDILNAFMGALKNMELRLNMQFIHGLPKDDILYGMLWCPIPNAVQLYRRYMFPSWTWLEWAGSAVYYPFHPFDSGRLKNDRPNAFASDDVPKDIGEGFMAQHVGPIKFKTDVKGALCFSSEIRTFRVERLTNPIRGETNPIRSDSFLTDEKGGRYSNTEQISIHSRMDVLFPFIVGSAIESLKQPCQFVFLARFQGLPIKRGPNLPPLVLCRVFALLVRPVDNDKFERIAMIDMPGDVWDKGVLLRKNANVILV